MKWLVQSVTCALIQLCTWQAAGLTDREVQAMADAVEEVCPLLEQESGLIAEIAAERRNPAGVIDLRRLHDLGELLAATRLQLGEARAEHREGLRVFQRFAKKPLDVGFCVAHREAAERG